MADLGTVVITEETFNKIKKVSFAWTSVNGGGDAGKATKTTENVYTGEIIRLVTVPSGAAAPTAAYDVVVNDEDSTDVLMSAGIDRHETNTEQVLASSLGCVANDKLTLNVTNAGNAKAGTVHLYIK